MASAWSLDRAPHPSIFGPIRAAPQPSQALRVLLVEDDNDTAESTAALLCIWGHEVYVVPDGPCALETGLAFQPDVVLLDLGLPGMDGFRLARYFRERPALRETTLVALTGYADEAHRQLAQEAGFDAYLVKPVEPVTLQSLLLAQHGRDGVARTRGRP